MLIVNGTQHEINIYLESDTYPVQGGRKLVLKTGAKPVMSIPAGVNLNAEKRNRVAPIDAPWAKGAVEFVSYDPIPDGDVVIVSNLYRSAVKELGGDTSRLATVDGAVYDSEDAKRPVGCLYLALG